MVIKARMQRRKAPGDPVRFGFSQRHGAIDASFNFRIELTGAFKRILNANYFHQPLRILLSCRFKCLPMYSQDSPIRPETRALGLRRFEYVSRRLQLDKLWH